MSDDDLRRTRLAFEQEGTLAALVRHAAALARSDRAAEALELLYPRTDAPEVRRELARLVRAPARAIEADPQVLWEAPCGIGAGTDHGVCLSPAALVVMTWPGPDSFDHPAAVVLDPDAGEARYPRVFDALGVLDGVLLARAGAAIRAHDLWTGETAAEWPSPEGELHWLDGSLLVVRDEAIELLAREEERLVSRFRARAPGGWISWACAAGEQLLLVGASDAAAEVVAIGASDGATRWRAPGALRCADALGALVERGGRLVAALDPSGATLWTGAPDDRAEGSPPVHALSPTRAFVGDRLYERATGAELLRLADVRVLAAGFAGETLHVAVQWRSTYAHELLTYAGERLVWRAATPPGTPVGVAALGRRLYTWSEAHDPIPEDEAGKPCGPVSRSVRMRCLMGAPLPTPWPRPRPDPPAVVVAAVPSVVPEPPADPAPIVAALVRRMHDAATDEARAVASSEAFVELQDIGEAAVPPLLEALDVAATRPAALWMLGVLGNAGAAAGPALARLLDDEWYREWAALALQAIQPADRVSVEALGRALREPALRRYAATALAAIGAAAAPARADLDAALESEADPALRSTLSKALGAIGE